jgi:hypothetical protein
LVAGTEEIRPAPVPEPVRRGNRVRRTGSAKMASMATRCDCPWQLVELHPDVQPVLLRVEDVVGCPAHAVVHEGNGTSV